MNIQFKKITKINAVTVIIVSNKLKVGIAVQTTPNSSHNCQI